DKLDYFSSLNTRVDDVEILFELLEEDDEETPKEIIGEVKGISKEIENLKIQILLSGEYDRNNAILTLHTGVGGTDANDWTEMLLRMYTRYCDKMGYKLQTLEYLEGDEAGIKSIFYSCYFYCIGNSSGFPMK
ncbi:MAG: prfB, partial [Defluviitaleaceae bacterium]|nr:prfB [Defluviitaleaceae bacterium]